MYQQVILDESSKQYVTINTHKGLFQLNRLPFGVSSSPAIFQQLMESLVASILNVAVYFDDILLSGQSDHLAILNQVLTRLQEACLHHRHIGITRMKVLARSYFWWPKLDADIEVVAKRCVTCQEHLISLVPAPLHPWEWLSKPWQRLHIDYVGPFMGHMFLILMDTHSKWMDAYPVTTATSTITIECLRKSFSNDGIPETIVSDNGSCFVSAEFGEFMQQNGMEHITSAPYHAWLC